MSNIFLIKSMDFGFTIHEMNNQVIGIIFLN